MEILEAKDSIIKILDDLWVTYNRSTLRHLDKAIIENGSQLTDKHIRLVQTLIREQFPKIGGLYSTLLQERCHNLPRNSIQIVHCLHRHHWIVASNILSASGHVCIYDSLHTTIDKESIDLVMAMFGTEDDSFVCIPKVQTQKGSVDCGPFAITLAHGEDHLRTVMSKAK